MSENAHDTNKYKDSDYSKSEIHEVLKVNIYRNPTSTPKPDPGIHI